MNVAPGGLRYGGACGVAGVLALIFSPLAAAGLFVLGAAAVLFHRDPERDVPAEGVVAPADGNVSVVRTEGDDERLRVGTFMNVHDVHVNRAPLPGTVVSVEHEPGAHRPAFSKESDRNERVRIEVETGSGTWELTMIAGAFARRIHPYVEEDDNLGRGERIGHISFGSRVDVLCPPSIDRSSLAVEKRETVRAGETVLFPADDAE